MMASNSVSKQRSDSLPLADDHHYRHLHQEPGYHDINYSSIDNGNWTEWSPIRSVIVRVITKPRSGSPVCLITSMKGRAVGECITAVSRKVVGKSARDNPERHCG